MKQSPLTLHLRKIDLPYPSCFKACNYFSRLLMIPFSNLIDEITMAFVFVKYCAGIFDNGLLDLVLQFHPERFEYRYVQGPNEMSTIRRQKSWNNSQLDRFFQNVRVIMSTIAIVDQGNRPLYMASHIWTETIQPFDENVGVYESLRSKFLYIVARFNR